MLHSTDIRDTDLIAKRNRNSNELNPRQMTEPKQGRSKSTILTRAIQEMNQGVLFNSYEQGQNYQSIVKKRLAQDKVNKQKELDANVLFVASMMDNAQQMIRLTKAMAPDPLSETPHAYSIDTKLKSAR